MALLDVIEDVRRDIAAAGSSINEADTKAALVTPILSELGWRGLQRIRYEYPVQPGPMRLDYALVGSSGTPVALIEAKAPRENLATHVDQILNYAFREGVDICVLTNGVLWWLYLPREKGEPAERRFAELDLENDDVTEVAVVLESCLEYQALMSGAGEERAKEILHTVQLEKRIRSEIPRAWQRLIAGPNEILIELVQEEVHDALGTRPSYESVKKELSNLVGRSSPTVVAHVPREVSTSRAMPAKPDSALNRRSRQIESPHVERPSGITLKGEYRRVSAWNDVLYQLAVLIWKRHPDDFHRILDWSGPNRRYVVLNMGDVPGTRRPKQIAGSPYFLDMNWSRPDVEKRVQELLMLFGYVSIDFEFKFD